ncbi:MAG TPA: NUDIX domain-containing protein [Egibacteraceae bacterium]|nr:NUDIX domain-containing protein [Egibacteraceae bacterium]
MGSAKPPAGVDGPLAAVRQAVAAIVPVDARERRGRARILVELDRLPRPFDEHADPVHVTASAVVVGPRGVLLHRHRRLGIWLQPGGHVEVGETPWDAAVREVVEEAGLVPAHPRGQPDVVHVDVHDGGPYAQTASRFGRHTHLDLRYLLTAGDDDPAPAPGESPQVRWFGWDEAVAVADDGLVGALRRLRP